MAHLLQLMNLHRPNIIILFLFCLKFKPHKYFNSTREMLGKKLTNLFTMKQIVNILSVFLYHNYSILPLQKQDKHAF